VEETSTEAVGTTYESSPTGSDVNEQTDDEEEYTYYFMPK
jgi:hypothetical protein